MWGWDLQYDGLVTELVETSKSSYFDKSSLPKGHEYKTGGEFGAYSLTAMARGMNVNLRSVMPPINGMESCDLFKTLNYTMPNEYGSDDAEIEPDAKLLWCGFSQVGNSAQAMKEATHFVNIHRKLNHT